MSTNSLPSDTGPRRASWLEAFYDLVYTIAIARLAQLLFHDPTPRGLAVFAGLFLTIFWGWAGYTAYASRHDREDVFQRLVVLAQMLAGIGMALQLDGVATRGGTGFVLSYVALRCCLLVLYERVRRDTPAVAVRAALLETGFGLGVLCWLASLAFPAPWRFAWWGLAGVIELTTPFRRAEGAVVLAPAPDHMPERFGLFTLIVLGETIGAVVVGLQGGSWHLATVAGAGAGFVAAAAIWWNYFNYVEHAPLQCSLGTGLAYSYLHLPLLGGLTLAAVGVGLAIAQAMGAAAAPMTLVMLTLGAVLWVLAFMLIQRVTYPKAEAVLIGRTSTLALAGLVLCGLAGAWLPGWVVLIGMAAVLLALAINDVRRRGTVPKRLFQSSAGPLSTGTKVYRSEEVAVSFDATRCVHSGECLRNLPLVFNTARRPWIDVRQGSVEDVVATVRHCPSGALQIVTGEGDPVAVEVDERSPVLHLVTGGPLQVPSGVRVTNEAGLELPPGPLMLCRCGRSANQPYCDGSHARPRG